MQGWAKVHVFLENEQFSHHRHPHAGVSQSSYHSSMHTTDRLLTPICKGEPDFVIFFIWCTCHIFDPTDQHARMRIISSKPTVGKFVKITHTLGICCDLWCSFMLSCAHNVQKLSNKWCALACVYLTGRQSDLHWQRDRMLINVSIQCSWLFNILTNKKKIQRKKKANKKL